MLQPVGTSAPASLLPDFEDALGRRYRPATRNPDTLPEILCFRHELTDVPAFEFALRERVARLASFRHPYYARIRKVDRLTDDRGTVALMSDCVPGIRMVDMLAAIERGGQPLSLDAALALVRQLTSAMILLHDSAQVAHGAIGPERLIVTPQARIFIVEHVLGAALEQLKFSRERYWSELRLALPVSAGLPRFDARADLTQLGVVALSLILGRRLADDDYPNAIDDLVAAAHSRTEEGSHEPVPTPLRDWLRRTLQLDSRHSFGSLADAQASLEDLLANDSRYNADVAAVEAFLASDRSAPVARVAAKPSRPNLIAEVPARKPQPIAERIHEEDDEPHAAPAPAVVKSRPAGYKWIAAGMALSVAAGIAVYGTRRALTPPAAVPTGTVSITTNPSGGRIEVDGVDRGVSPLRLSLPAGAHVLTVRGNGDPRVMAFNIEPNVDVSRYVELPTPSASTGQVQIRTEPSGARVTVDGVPQGTTPLTVADLSPGEHLVTVEGEHARVTQPVTIQAGLTSALVVPLIAAQAAPSSGWITVSAQFAMDVYEGGRMLGNSRMDRIPLSPGRHDIEIVNEGLGFREARTVQIAPGKSSVVGITLPKGTLSLNATPWANVSIDGDAVGETPLGNLSLTIGPHEVVFSNPQLGEQRRIITVSDRAPVRFSIDMTKK